MRTRIYPAVIALLLSISFFQIPPPAQAQPRDSINKTVVKVFIVLSKYDFYNPWKRKNHRRGHGSGVMIKGNRILTNAHVVANQTYLQIQPYGNPKKYEASVEFVSHEADLAILNVKDESIFDGVEPLDIGPMPEPSSDVTVYGYPTGGQSLSITRGVLSRFDYYRYSHSGYTFIAGQIDAALNPGNSGGPIVSGNKIVGIAMQVNRAPLTESLGYFIPPAIINHFLDDIADGSYDGFPEIGLIIQPLDSPSLKQKYGIGDELTGVRINRIIMNSKAEGLLRVGDVILEIDGHDIADDGSVEFRAKERVSFTHHVDIKQIGDELKLKVHRDGESLDVTLTLDDSGEDFDFVRLRSHDKPPEYLIFGGLVITPLSQNLLCHWGHCKAPQALMNENDKFPTVSRSEAVTIIRVLPHEVNEGYHGLSSWVPTKLNGTPIKSFRDLHVRLTRSTDRFVSFTDEHGFEVVIDRNLAEKSHMELLELYDINSDSHIVE